ncbi:MAG: aminopeptidase P family protein [Deltaproteobacteria bacterium]|nr:aminopeptidase P family protein [Deltaproteobacteria bacterium]
MTAGERRLARLHAVLRRRGIGAYLCVRLSNVRYLTGFTGSEAALLVVPGDAILFTDGRYDVQARGEVRGAQVVVTGRKWADVSRRLRKTGARKIGFESRYLSVESFRALARGGEKRWILGEDLVEPLRMRKEPGEIREIEAATAIAAAALLRVLSGGTRGRTERAVAADLEREMIRRGADGVSFPPIVADAARSAMPHASPGGSRISGKGPLVLDFGARKNGYCSDETVTVIPSRPEPRIGKVFDAVRRAQEAGLAVLRPGVRCKQVDAKVRESLDRSGYLKYFVHSTGHGVGLDIHERPSISIRSKDRIAEGMVVTVEPGVYLPGVGGVRLEDTVKVTATGCERITFLPKAAASLV